MSKLNVNEIEGQTTSQVKIKTPSVVNLQKMDNTITDSLTVEAGKNALSVGPISVPDGVTVTIADGSVWAVI